MSEQQPLSAEEEERELEEAAEAFSENEGNPEDAAADREERELEEAEKAFEEKNKTIVAQQSGDETTEDEENSIKNVDGTPSTKDTLIALGFKRKEDSEPNKVQYTLTDGEVLIGRTFTEQFKKGKFWAIKNSVFLQDEELKELSLVKKFYAIREGKEQLPEKIGEEQQGKTESKTEETAEENQRILGALGFTRYDNKEKGIACKLKAGQLLIGRTFTEKYPTGNMWVSCLVDCEHGKKGEFLKRDECKQISQVVLFYRIRDGELPMPEPIVTGKITGKTEKAIQIQIEEFGQTETEWWGFGALKRNEEGVTYIPASYSKQTEKYNAKMQVPRNIILENYETELEKVPLTQTDMTKEKDVPKEEKVEPRPTEKITMDEVIKQDPTKYTETILKYVGILAEVTEAIFGEDRIPGREKGYGVKFVFEKVCGEMENTGDDPEEQV